MNRYLFTLLVLLSLLPSHADTLDLKGGDRLRGDISSIQDEHVTLQSAATSTPLQVRQSALERVFFSNPASLPTSHSELITLKNGDTLPCSLLALNDSELKVDTTFAGAINLPRTSVSTVQFGMKPEKVIYQDAADLSQWEIENGQWNVISEKVNETIHQTVQKKYACLGRGTIAKKIDSPNNIKISYDLEWDTSINFTFKFCADNKGPVEQQSAYVMFINYAGIQVSRHQGDAYKKLIHNSMQINALQKKKIHIGIHLNKKSGEINVLVNNNFIGASADDVLDPVKGDYMTFNIGSGDGCRISNFKITKLAKNSNVRLDTLSGASDLLIDNEGTELKGSIQSIKKEGADDKRMISFLAKNSPDQALETPEDSVSILYFGKTDADDDEPVKSALKVIFPGKGELQLDNVKFTDQKITGKHPYLGHCEIDTKSLSSLQYQNEASE